MRLKLRPRRCFSKASREAEGRARGIGGKWGGYGIKVPKARRFIGPPANEAAMGEMRKLNEMGDVKVTWNPQKPDEVAAARAVFESTRGKYVAFEGKGKERGKRLDTFDPQAKSILLIPAISGGSN